MLAGCLNGSTVQSWEKVDAHRKQCTYLAVKGLCDKRWVTLFFLLEIQLHAETHKVQIQVNQGRRSL